jgi:hypothetical protein
VTSLPRIIGLDFGTTNTRVLLGYADRPDQSVAPIELPGSDHDSLPTVILIDGTGALVEMGKSAEEALQEAESRDWVRYEFKPCLGRSERDLSAQSCGPALQLKCPSCGDKIPEGFRFCGKCGQPLPEDYCQKVEERALRYKRDEAFTYAGLLLNEIGLQIRRRTLGGNWEPGDLVVVGVPVHWSEETRGEYADLVRRTFGNDKVETVYEPQAALSEYLSRASDEVHAGEVVLVIDVGGGTTDLVAGVVREEGTLDQERSYGIRFGGADFDDSVVLWAMRQLGCESEGVHDPTAAGLRPLCRDLKEQLSDAVRTDRQGENPQRRKQVLLPGLQGQLKLDRITFESDEVAGPLLSYLETSLADAVRQMGLRAEDLNHVLLIGGGSRAYFVEEIARKAFPRAKIVAGQQPEMAIGRGLVVAVTGRPRVKKKNPLATLIAEVDTLVGQEQWDNALSLLQVQPENIRLQPRFLYQRLLCLHRLGRDTELLQMAKGHENDHESIAKLVETAAKEVAKAQQPPAAPTAQSSRQVLDVKLEPEFPRPPMAPPTSMQYAPQVMERPKPPPRSSAATLDIEANPTQSTAADDKPVSCPLCHKLVPPPRKQCECGEWVRCPECGSTLMVGHEHGAGRAAASTAVGLIAGAAVGIPAGMLVRPLGGMAGVQTYNAVKKAMEPRLKKCLKCGHVTKMAR